MKIILKEITIRELTDGFADNNEQGVVAYGRSSHLNGKETFKRIFIRNKKPSK